MAAAIVILTHNAAVESRPIPFDIPTICQAINQLDIPASLLTEPLKSALENQSFQAYLGRDVKPDPSALPNATQTWEKTMNELFQADVFFVRGEYIERATRDSGGVPIYRSYGNATNFRDGAHDVSFFNAAGTYVQSRLVYSGPCFGADPTYDLASGKKAGAKWTRKDIGTLIVLVRLKTQEPENRSVAYAVAVHMGPIVSHVYATANAAAIPFTIPPRFGTPDKNVIMWRVVCLDRAYALDDDYPVDADLRYSYQLSYDGFDFESKFADGGAIHNNEHEKFDAKTLVLSPPLQRDYHSPGDSSKIPAHNYIVAGYVRSPGRDAHGWEPSVFYMVHVLPSSQSVFRETEELSRQNTREATWQINAPAPLPRIIPVSGKRSLPTTATTHQWQAVQSDQLKFRDTVGDSASIIDTRIAAWNLADSNPTNVESRARQHSDKPVLELDHGETHMKIVTIVNNPSVARDDPLSDVSIFLDTVVYTHAETTAILIKDTIIDATELGRLIPSTEYDAVRSVVVWDLREIFAARLNERRDRIHREKQEQLDRLTTLGALVQYTTAEAYYAHVGSQTSYTSLFRTNPVLRVLLAIELEGNMLDQKGFEIMYDAKPNSSLVNRLINNILPAVSLNTLRENLVRFSSEFLANAGRLNDSASVENGRLKIAAYVQLANATLTELCVNAGEVVRFLSSSSSYVVKYMPEARKYYDVDNATYGDIMRMRNISVSKLTAHWADTFRRISHPSASLIQRWASSDQASSSTALGEIPFAIERPFKSYAREEWQREIDQIKREYFSISASSDSSAPDYTEKLVASIERYRRLNS